MANELDELSRLLGRLEEGIQELKAEAQVGRAQRAEVILRLGNMETVSVRVSELERRADRADRSIIVHENWRQRGIGIAKFATVAAGLLGSGITLFIEWLNRRH